MSSTPSNTQLKLIGSSLVAIFLNKKIKVSGARPICPIIQCSFGLQLHGVNFASEEEGVHDVDFLVSNMVLAKQALEEFADTKLLIAGRYKLELQTTRGPSAVNELFICDTEGTQAPLPIQLILVYQSLQNMQACLL